MITAASTTAATCSSTPICKGKQRAQASNDEIVTLDNGGLQADWDEAARHYKLILPFGSSGTSNPSLVIEEIEGESETVLERVESDKSVTKVFSTYRNFIGNVDEKTKKIADLGPRLTSLIKVCGQVEKEIQGYQASGKYHANTPTATMSLQERMEQGLALFGELRSVAQQLLTEPKLEEKLIELCPYITKMADEVIKLQESLPTPAKVWLGILYFAALVAPIITVIWYILSAAGLFSMSAFLPQILAGGAWVLFVLLNIIKSWPDLKNARDRDTHAGTYQLISCYERTLQIQKDILDKMNYADIKANKDLALANSHFAFYNSVRSDQIKVCVGTLSEKQDQFAQSLNDVKQLLVARAESASPELLEKRIAELEKENRQLREYNMKLMEAALNNADRNV